MTPVLSRPVTALQAPADSERRAGTDVTGTGAGEEATRRYVRSPEDVLRLVVFASIAVLVAGFTVWFEESILGFEDDLLQLFGFVDSDAIRVVHGVIEIVSLLIGVTVYLVAFSTRRYRLLGYVAAAAITTFAVMSGIDWLIDRSADELRANSLLGDQALGDSFVNGVVQVSQLSAMFVVVRPFVGRQWRRAGIVTIVLLVLAELVIAAQLPVDLFLALPVGAAIGTAVLLVFGRPDRHPTLAGIAAALHGAGLPVSEVHPAKVDARGSTPYFATLDDGTGLFVKVLGGQERAADLLFRVYRFLRLKNVGDDRPFSSLRRTVEHEALVALMARDIGVRTPRLRGVVDVGNDSMLLAYEMIDGSSLDGVADDDVTDDLMRAVWAQVALLRDHRTAHRDLRRANVFVQDDGVPWLIDFGFSEVAVPDGILDADVAQMLASFAVVVGAERAVGAAVDVLGPDVVGDALPRLQMKALSGATQTALKAQPGLLAAAPGRGRGTDGCRGRAVRAARTHRSQDGVRRRPPRRRHLLPRPTTGGSPGHHRPGRLGAMEMDSLDPARLGDDVRRRSHQPLRCRRQPIAGRAAACLDGGVVVRQQAGASRYRWHGAQRALPAEAGRRRTGRRVERGTQHDRRRGRPRRASSVSSSSGPDATRSARSSCQTRSTSSSGWRSSPPSPWRGC